MKKILLAAAVAFLSAGAAAAQELVKELYDGEAVAVTWENPLYISADKFADGVQAGYYVSVELADATDVIEFKGNGEWLPGSILTNIDGRSEAKFYLTTDAVEAVKTYGLEIIGKQFTVTKVNLMNDGFIMPVNAIWGGFFYMYNWTTMELYKTAFDNYTNQQYLVVNFDANKDDYTDYDINIMTAFDSEPDLWGNNENITRESNRAVLDLTDVDVAAQLENHNALLIQINTNDRPFNVTSVEFSNEITSAVSDIVSVADATVDVYNLQGMPVRTGVASGEAVVGLPAGIYIVGNRKVAVR